MKDVFKMERKERADRTYQRLVYYKLCELRGAVLDAQKNGAELGVTGELDLLGLIGDIKAVGEIECKVSGEIVPARIASEVVEKEAEKGLELAPEIEEIEY